MVEVVVFNRLPLVGGYISGEFRELYDLGDGLYEHGGADLLVANGPTLGAAVVNPDAVDDRAKVIAVNPGNGDFGNHVMLDHVGTAEWSMYAHLRDFAPGLRVGQLLKSGQGIGFAGATGKVTGAHLHWEVVSNPAAPTFGSIRTAPDASGVKRLVAGITLRNPRDYLKLVIGPIVPPVAVATLADVMALVTAQGKSIATISDRVIGMDSRLGKIDAEALANAIAGILVERLRG